MVEWIPIVHKFRVLMANVGISYGRSPPNDLITALKINRDYNIHISIERRGTYNSKKNLILYIKIHFCRQYFRSFNNKESQRIKIDYAVDWINKVRRSVE